MVTECNQFSKIRCIDFGRHVTGPDDPKSVVFRPSSIGRKNIFRTIRKCMKGEGCYRPLTNALRTFLPCQYSHR